MPHKILVTDKINEAGLAILESCAEVDYKPGLNIEEIKSIIKNYDAILIRSQTNLTNEILAHTNGKMKIIGRAGVGVDNVDLEIATEKGIIVVNSPEGNTIAAAEHTIALMFALSRQIPQADKSAKEHKWDRAKFVGTELADHVLGIIGLGKIGQRVGKVAHALGMRVLAYDPFVSDERVSQLGFTKVDLEDIWSKSDYITLHIPKTKETENLINKETIKKMKDDVRIINCVRGGIINEQDLADAIKNGKVGGAAFDVFETEPCTDSPLHKCADEGSGDKIVLTPHLGASTKQAQLNVAIDVAEQIRDVLTGGVARSAVNLPGLKPELVIHIKHYLAIAEHMGSMLAQITDGAITEIEIEALGQLSNKNIEGLRLAVLKGALSTIIDGVSFVNAPMIAKERGIKVYETKSEDSGAYIDKLRIKAISDKGSRVIAGTVHHGEIPAIVQIDDYPVNIKPENHAIVTFHKDRPGIVAQVSKILWDKKINISSLNLGRNAIDGLRAGSQGSQSAVMVINVDDPVDKETLVEISKIQDINVAKYISLKGKI